jgi:hypothetical protein
MEHLSYGLERPGSHPDAIMSKLLVHHRIYTRVHLQTILRLVSLSPLRLRMTRCPSSLSIVSFDSRWTCFDRPVLIDLLNKNKSRSWELRLSWGSHRLLILMATSSLSTMRKLQDLVKFWHTISALCFGGTAFDMLA